MQAMTPYQPQPILSGGNIPPVVNVSCVVTEEHSTTN